MGLSFAHIFVCSTFLELRINYVEENEETKKYVSVQEHYLLKFLMTDKDKMKIQ